MLLPALVPLVLAVSLNLAVGAADPSSGKDSASKFRRLESLTKQCKFTLGGQQFDLCPVLEGNEGGWTTEIERKTPPTVTKTSYQIALQGPLAKDKNATKYDQCPPGTWICQIVTNRRPLFPDEEPRVLQTVPVAGAMNLPNVTRYHPGVNITAQLAPGRQEDAKHDVLHVRLHGGYYVYGPQKADLQFICDHGVDEPTKPSYAWSWNGTHTFNWRTKHACGKQLSPPARTGTVTASPGPKPTSGAPTDSEPAEDAPPDDNEGVPDKSEQDLADKHPLLGRASRQTLVLLLSSFTAVLALVYVAWFPPARVRQAVSRFMKAHPRLARFRVGERVLMRWAYEDLEMEDGYGYGEGEEDVMVNYAPEVEEGIPLKPSPRLGGFAGYGAA
ncbi:uncharacterized protein TRAVEDRAFT_30502 [Trametes versicolor FP-101664 SS1]|uniref:uncharacterized protein n=1 Tax=Trametes versicolor (strain FP-101664) TaxID=717944 RepID=UPI000462215D|nr:uncharacterized protein TRAVEDRAFT_30502 [Trametes versicolor FP-101664 SS1]EIW55777.1 hypothetical protein TRAVEDRAFT_30502 [Trametes versicolor FP-101664 SS1]